MQNNSKVKEDFPVLIIIALYKNDPKLKSCVKDCFLAFLLFWAQVSCNACEDLLVLDELLVLLQLELFAFFQIPLNRMVDYHVETLTLPALDLVHQSGRHLLWMLFQHMFQVLFLG